MSEVQHKRNCLAGIHYTFLTLFKIFISEKKIQSNFSLDFIMLHYLKFYTIYSTVYKLSKHRLYSVYFAKDIKARMMQFHVKLNKANKTMAYTKSLKHIYLGIPSGISVGPEVWRKNGDGFKIQRKIYLGEV
ncbi:hypothetical protein R5R35_010145 [Gryllus longicercus]|uniref:Uncharacterized protein n=1 Tax=Gryllus longicercus TaxID=2509291 RepID=A0AAN9VBH8_9ORTH